MISGFTAASAICFAKISGDEPAEAETTSFAICGPGN